MNWKLKALLQRVCGALPCGRTVYYQLQRRIGGLRNPDYLGKFRRQHDMARRLARHGVSIEGARMMEVGTGWIPILPIGFWVCGAASVRTYDLNRHCSPDLVSRALGWMSHNREVLLELWRDLPRRRIDERIRLAANYAQRPDEFLRLANIEYIAPADAARTSLPPESIDIHFSTNVFEHIPSHVLLEILREARRILCPGGVALHHVDPSDHFSHADKSLSSINFLQFEEAEWAHYGGTAFAYHNRLRDSDYRKLFASSSFELAECSFTVDKHALDVLRSGLTLAEPFRNCDAEELCRLNLDYVAFAHVHEGVLVSNAAKPATHARQAG